MAPIDPVIPFLVGLAIGLILLIVVVFRSKLRHQGDIAAARTQSVNQSRSTLKGQMAEQMAPLLPGFVYSPADSKFLGDPIDYVIFDGLTEARDGTGDLDAVEVVLIDVKYGKADLNKYQRAIARAVEAGRIRFEVVRIAPDHSVTTAQYKPRKRRDAADESTER